MILFVGMPWMHKGKLYNVAAVLNRGRILGIVPKKHLPNYSEFYELRHFNPGMEKVEMTDWEGVQVPMGMNLLFACRTMPELVLAAELCEDVWVPCPPSISHALAGATVIAMKRQERTSIVITLSADSLQGWCAVIFMQMQEKGSHPRIWYLADRISLRKTAPVWYSLTGLKMPASVQTWILEGSSASAAV